VADLQRAGGGADCLPLLIGGREILIGREGLTVEGALSRLVRIPAIVNSKSTRW
jgi:hypothetical protein